MSAVLVVALGFASAGSVVATGTALAVENPITTQYGNKAQGWHVIDSDGTYGYFGKDGWYTGRTMVNSQFNAMAERAAYGAQKLGTGVGSGYTSAASSGEAVATKLKTIGTGAGTLATLRGLKGDTLGVMSRLKSFGLLKSLGTVALAATAFETGWKIGSLISSVFWPSGGSEKPVEAYAAELTAVDPGEALGTSGSETACTVKPCVKTMYAPSAGSRVEFNLKTGSPADDARVMVGEPQCGTGGGTVPLPEGVPAGAVQIPGGSVRCGIAPDPERRQVYGIFFVPLAVSHLPGEPGQTATKETSGQTPENATGATGKMKECFEAAIACGAFPGWWWNNDPQAKEHTTTEDPRLGLDPADPLSVQVPVPEVGERYGHYDERLEALKLKPKPAALSEAATDPALGPEQVVSTSPHIGASVGPEAEIRVRYNPASAPETETEQGYAGGGSGWSAPAIPAIDMSPLAGVGSPCDVFPFGLFCWLGEALGQFNTTGVCPHFSAPVAGTESDFSVTLCGETAETIMGYLRPAILLAFIIGLGFLFARGTRAVGGD